RPRTDPALTHPSPPPLPDALPICLRLPPHRLRRDEPRRGRSRRAGPLRGQVRVRGGVAVEEPRISDHAAVELSEVLLLHRRRVGPVPVNTDRLSTFRDRRIRPETRTLSARRQVRAPDRRDEFVVTVVELETNPQARIPVDVRHPR